MNRFYSNIIEKRIFIIVTLFLFISALSYSSDLENNLKMAGKNRNELENVLKHYKKTNEKLKLQAAEFLISNMDAHAFYQSKSLDSFYKTLDSILTLNDWTERANEKQEILIKTLQTPDFNDIVLIPDLEYISADFLIDNIDRAFKSWESPWAKHLNFDEFCEFLLPYRVSDERPVYWRTQYRDSIISHVENILNTNSLANDLIFYFPFDKNGKDFSGNKRNARLKGNITFSIKDKNAVAELNGNDSYITIPHKIDSPSQDFTVAFWINQKEKRSDAHLFDFGKDTSTYICFSPCAKNGLAQFSIKKPRGTVQSINANALPINEWVHVTITLSKKTLRIFIDGIESRRKNISYTLGNIGFNKNNFIGKAQKAKAPLYNGQVDDFRFYSRALNDYEIQTLVGKKKDARLQEAAWEIDRIYHHQLYHIPLFFGGYNSTLLAHIKMGTCFDYTALNNFVFRSLDIPAVMDYVPQWANRNWGHSWNALISEDGEILDSSDQDSLGHHLRRRIVDNNNLVSKVFRSTFAKQNTSLAVIKGKEAIPYEFDSPCIKDVTDTYINCVDPVISLAQPTTNKNKFAYLCTFDNRDWIPVSWGSIENKVVKFLKMGKGIVYLPAYCNLNGIVPAAQPFILTDSGQVKILNPDFSHLRKIKLTRKFIEGRNSHKYRERILDSKIQVANKEDFSDAVTYSIDIIPEENFNTIHLALKKPYRYFRFAADLKSFGCEIAEIEAYGGDSIQKLKGRIIGNYGISEQKIQEAFDGKALSSYKNFNPNGWFGMDFGNPVKISALRYLPRNDDNFISEGEKYELFYWNNRWISLGEQVGDTKQYLEYENVPSNALFWLRNLTKGREERIFTYENEKQVWW